MKIAVCISGLVKCGHKLNTLQNNNSRIKKIFPDADFHYSTWDSFEEEFNENFPDEKCHFFPEPEISYHPYLDIKKEDHISHHFSERIPWAKRLSKDKIIWTSHHCKQIIAHALLVDTLKERYDVIIRARYDSFFHKKANFDRFIKDTYDNKYVHGFSVTRKDKFNDFYDSPMELGSKHEHYLLDQMIIHHANRFDTKMVFQLFNEKKLHPAEFGWYQVLSMPYGGIHKNHHGMVNHDKNVLDKFILEHR